MKEFLKFLLCLLGAVLYAFIISLVLMFIFSSFANAAMSWGWIQIIVYVILAIVALFVIIITVGKYINVPFAYTCHDKINKLVAVGMFICCSVNTIVPIWKLSIERSTTLVAIILNVPVVICYVTLIISVVTINSPTTGTTSPRVKNLIFSYKVGDYVTLVDDEDKPMRKIIVLEKDKKGNIFVMDVLTGWRHWYTPEQLAQFDIRYRF